MEASYLKTVKRKTQFFFSRAYRFDYSKYNAPILEEVEDENGKCWNEVLDDNNWLNLGYAPRPRNKLEWVFYDLMMGVLMKYPSHKIILYIISHHIVGFPKENI